MDRSPSGQACVTTLPPTSLPKGPDVSRPHLIDFLREDFERLPSTVWAPLAALNGQRVFLTGGTGFFGRHLLALWCVLRERGVQAEVTVASRDPAAFLRAWPEFDGHPWLRLVPSDLRRVPPCTGPYELMIHAATDTHASAHQDPSQVWRGMMHTSQVVLEAAQAWGVQRLLLTGSGAQYGRMGPEGVTDDALQACDPLLPGSAYGEAKRASELMAMLQAAATGMTVVPTRCFAFAGPSLDLQGHFAIGNFVRDACAGQPIRIQSGGTALRSYLYGADLAVWLTHLLLHGEHGRPVNVGGDTPVSIRELAETVSQALSPGLPPQVLGQDAPGTRSVYFPQTARAAQHGLQAWTSLALSVRRMGQWVNGGQAG